MSIRPTANNKIIAAGIMVSACSICVGIGTGSVALGVATYFGFLAFSLLRAID